MLKSYLISDQIVKFMPYFRPKRLANHIPWRHTYQPSLYKGVNPPPPLTIACQLFLYSVTGSDVILSVFVRFLLLLKLYLLRAPVQRFLIQGI